VKIWCAVACALALLVGLAPTVVGAAPVVSAPFVTVDVGDTFTISVSVTEAADLTHWQFSLGFDPAIVQANLVTEGDFMSAFGATLFIPGAIDNTSGLISLVADSYIDLPPLPSGDGTLATIEFTALSPGVSPLSLSDVFLNLSDQDFGIENGQITVAGSTPPPPVPAPTTLVLLASGLVLLGVGGLARGQRWVDGKFTVAVGRLP